MLYKLNRRAVSARRLCPVSIKETPVNRQLPGAVARAGTALSFGLLGFALCYATPSAQDRLKTMPGYEQYQKMSAQIPGAVRSGAVSGTWSADGSGVEYSLDGKRYRFDVAARSATELGAAATRLPAGAADAAAGAAGRASSADVRRRRPTRRTAS